MVDAGLDHNPKIRRAGRNGREVYLFVLRRNRVHGAKGVIPAAELEDWYLADLLMMTKSDASDGVTAAVTAGLLSFDGASCRICGWDEDWSRRPKTGAERQQIYRVRREVTNSSLRVTKSDASDVVEKRREEEKREREPRKRDRARKPTAGLATSFPDGWEPNDLDTPEKRAAFEKFKNNHISKGHVFVSWPHAWGTWKSRESDFGRPVAANAAAQARFTPQFKD